MTDPQFPEPPAEGLYLETEEQEEPPSSYTTELPVEESESMKHSDVEEQNASQDVEKSESHSPTTDEQVKDYCFVEHSGLQQDDVVEPAVEAPTEEVDSSEFEPPPPENGHNSEESCGSFLLIKPGTEGEPVLPEANQSTPEMQHTRPESSELSSEPPAYEDIHNGLVVEPNEITSDSHTTQPVESHSPSEFSYQSEPLFEQGQQPPPFSGVSIELKKSVELECNSSVPVYNIAPQDTSLGTTAGVSELMSDLTGQEATTHTLTCYEDLTGSIGVEQGYQTSFDGGSSYHDDVPVEEADDLQGREEVSETIETRLLRGDEQSASTRVGETRFIKTAPEKELCGIVEETPKPSFQEICADLDRKNVVSHLHQCNTGQFVMHHHPQTGSLRQQDIVVLNPQTGEVLGSNAQPVQKISLMSGGQSPKVDIVQASAGDAANGTATQPSANSTDSTAGQAAQPYSYRPPQDGSGGGSSLRGGGAGGNGAGGGSNGHMITNGSMERARQAYNMADCQMAQLTVFMDRALVCRRIRPRFNASEITEVLFEHLSPAIDKDSVRVEIRGAATILDVTYVARSLANEEDTWSHAISQLNAELHQCHRQAESLTGRLARAGKQRMVLDTFADNLIRKDEENATGANATPPSTVPNHVGGSNTAPPTHGAPSPLLGGDHKGSLEVINPYDPRNMDTLHRFLGMYEEQAERLDATLLDTNEELDQVQARIEAIEKELHEIELKQDERLARELSVLVEPRETGQVEMLISYVVGKCSWRPAYDIRIFNSDGTMKIVYYGMVQQATGENWETRSMALSTTLPGTGGTVPPLGLQRVQFKKDHSPATPTKQQPATSTVTQLPPPSTGYGTVSTRTRSTSKMGGFRKSARPTTTSFHEADRILSDYEREASTPVGTLQRGHSTEIAPSPSAPRSAVTRMHSRRGVGTSMLFHAPIPPTPLHPSRGSAGAQVSNAAQPCNSANIPTVHLDVPRPPGLIRCDNQAVRVTVGLLDLQPRYEYVTVPKRSLHAYLKATAVNRSDFTILAGETNIYADNTFIGKSEIPAVAQGEEFSCNLGAEQGIKVFYRPLFKYREAVGSNSKHATLTFKQLIEVRNTFDRPIHLMVMDQVPLSCEDKIKINLLEPVIKHPEKYDRNKPIRMNKSNNVEWDLDLAAGETKELTLKYSIEHPANEDLDVSVSET